MEDPALLAMGLVPARSTSAIAIAASANGAAIRWRMAWSMVGLGLVVLFAAFWPTVQHTVSTWYHSATFNHGFLILPIVGYLVWIKRGTLASTVPRPCWWGLAPIVASGLVWLVGHAASVMLVEQFALLGMIYGLILAVLGTAVVRRLRFALFYLVFAVPFGEFMVAPLQDFTAHFVVAGLRIIGIPVLLDGVFLSIPTGNFEVAEACAGVRFLIATVALGFLFAYITYASWWRRAAFVALSLVVPVIANGFRAFGIVIIAYLTNNEVAVGVDHIVYGWIFFAFVTVVLLAIGMTFREDMPEESAPDLKAMNDAATTAGSPRQTGVATGAALAAALVMPLYAGVVDARPVPKMEAALAVPAVGNGWQAVERARPEWTPTFPTADATLLRSFAKDGQEVQLYIAFYTRQRQEAELVHNDNRIADGKNWSRAASGQVLARIDGDERAVAITRLLRNGRGRVAYHWYWIAGRYVADPYRAKALQALERLRGGGGAAAVIVVGTGYEDRPSDAQARLADFLSAAGPFRAALERSAPK